MIIEVKKSVAVRFNNIDPHDAMELFVYTQYT